MVWRSAIGALSVVAVMAAVAAALPERSAGTSVTAAKEPAFGQLAKPQFTSADDGGAVAAQAAERSDLLRLASYAVPPVRRPVPTVMPPSQPDAGKPPGTSSTEISTSTAVSAAGATLGFAPAPAHLPAADAVNAEATSPPPKAETKSRVASAEAPSPEESGPSRSTGLVNINKAPVAALDRLPGAGRIGQAIARRRPYRTVDDLVRKRVLRAGVFNRIKGSISVD